MKGPSQEERDQLRTAIPELMRGPVAPMPTEFPRRVRPGQVIPFTPRKVG